MESGLEDRNNRLFRLALLVEEGVSMESGLEDRNNEIGRARAVVGLKDVSMESGLEDRNN